MKSFNIGNILILNWFKKLIRDHFIIFFETRNCMHEAQSSNRILTCCIKAFKIYKLKDNKE